MLTVQIQDLAFFAHVNESHPPRSVDLTSIKPFARVPGLVMMDNRGRLYVVQENLADMGHSMALLLVDVDFASGHVKRFGSIFYDDAVAACSGRQPGEFDLDVERRRVFVTGASPRPFLDVCEF